MAAHRAPVRWSRFQSPVARLHGRGRSQSPNRAATGAQEQQHEEAAPHCHENSRQCTKHPRVHGKSVIQHIPRLVSQMDHRQKEKYREKDHEEYRMQYAAPFRVFYLCAIPVWRTYPQRSVLLTLLLRSVAAVGRGVHGFISAPLLHLAMTSSRACRWRCGRIWRGRTSSQCARAEP
jgi:hypothetical protein